MAPDQSQALNCAPPAFTRGRGDLVRVDRIHAANILINGNRYAFISEEMRERMRGRG